jgi:hypothetical protein
MLVNMRCSLSCPRESERVCSWNDAKLPPSDVTLVTRPEAGSTLMLPSSSCAAQMLTAKFCKQRVVSGYHFTTNSVATCRGISKVYSLAALLSS